QCIAAGLGISGVDDHESSPSLLKPMDPLYLLSHRGIGGPRTASQAGRVDDQRHFHRVEAIERRLAADKLLSDRSVRSVNAYGIRYQECHRDREHQIGEEPSGT